MSDYPRKRASVACEVCRGRRTKCDGQRPRCGFCQTSDAECVYRQAAEPPPSRLETEIATIRERLDHITDLLVEREQANLRPVSQHQDADGISPHSDMSLAARSSCSRVVSDLHDSDFPVMTIQRTSMMRLLGLDPKTADWLSDVERASPAVTGSGRRFASSKLFMLQPQRVTCLVAAFAERIHCWYPVLSKDFSEVLDACLHGSSRTAADTCLAMLVLAIGSLAEKRSIGQALEERPDSVYLEEALPLLPEVISDYTLASLQCLIFYSVYYQCRLRPCQANDYILMASYKAQNMLKGTLFSSNPVQMQSLRRAYWAILLIESELSVQLDMVNSGISKYDEKTPLPASEDVWSYSHAIGIPPDMENSPVHSFSPESLLSPSQSADLTRSYFLAEIAMRRMLQRCTTSVSKSAGGRLQYAPVIAKELELQLNEWFEYLPPDLQFCKTPADESEVALVPRATFLQTQYSACKASIYWPAVVQVIERDTANTDTAYYCTQFFNSYVSFIITATAASKTCLPNAWTLSASIFIISMAALRGAHIECLQHIINPRLKDCFVRALDTFESTSSYSPSLAALQEPFRDAVERLR